MQPKLQHWLLRKVSRVKFTSERAAKQFNKKFGETSGVHDTKTFCGPSIILYVEEESRKEGVLAGEKGKEQIQMKFCVDL